MQTPVSKVCHTCGAVKPACQFYRAARSRDGLRSNCKECFKVAAKRQEESRQELFRVMEEAHLEMQAYFQAKRLAEPATLES